MLPTATFGGTGHRSSRVIFGAAALGWSSQKVADQVLEILLDFGVNHIDVAAAYGDAEVRLAPWMVEHRNQFFLATKTGARDGPGARASLERSLERLGVNQVDLIQLHNLVEQEEWEVAHSPGGAVDALQQARDDGLVRFIGVTGHGLRIARMHLRSLERFDYDSVLLPYSYPLLQISEYRRDVEELLAVCAGRRVAVQTIKAIARRRFGEQADEEQTSSPPPRRFSWYEPLSDPDAIGRAISFVLHRPGLFLNTSSDIRHLRTVLKAASDTQRQGKLSEGLLADDVSRFDMQPLFDGAELDRI